MSAYLESAFRTVTESGVLYKTAEQYIGAMNQELNLADTAGLDVDASDVLLGVKEATEEVKIASDRLHKAILAAAEAGKEGGLDKALEDVITAALEYLKSTNENLFIKSQALHAATAVVRDVRAKGEKSVDQDQIASAVAQAKQDAQTEFNEMRKRWDHAAQDVFSAFLARMSQEQGSAAKSG